MKFAKFTEEMFSSKGDISSARILAYILAFFAMAVITYSIITKTVDPNIVEIVKKLFYAVVILMVGNKGVEAWRNKGREEKDE